MTTARWFGQSLRTSPRPGCVGTLKNNLSKSTRTYGPNWQVLGSHGPPDGQLLAQNRTAQLLTGQLPTAIAVGAACCCSAAVASLARDQAQPARLLLVHHKALLLGFV